MVFSTECNFVIILFLLEAFSDKLIPSDFEYRKQIQNKQNWTWQQIPNSKTYWVFRKNKYILPDATGNNFVKEFSHKQEHRKKLKEFRDEIIHSKSFEDKGTPNLTDLILLSVQRYL